MPMGLFDRIKAGLQKTRAVFSGHMDELVENYKKLDDEFFEDLSDILIMADVGMKTTELAVSRLREKCKAEKIGSAEQAREALKEILADMMRTEPMRLESPMVLLVIGVNGVGKTTTIGKLATRFKTVGRRVIICAADTFRAAAAEQLTVWAERADVPIIKQKEGADPAAVVFDGIQAARGRHADVLIVDTAGRPAQQDPPDGGTEKDQPRGRARIPGGQSQSPAGHRRHHRAKRPAAGHALQGSGQHRGHRADQAGRHRQGRHRHCHPQRAGPAVYYIGFGEQIDDLQPFDAKQFVDAIFG